MTSWWGSAFVFSLGGGIGGFLALAAGDRLTPPVPLLVSCRGFGGCGRRGTTGGCATPMESLALYTSITT